MREVKVDTLIKPDGTIVLPNSGPALVFVLECNDGSYRARIEGFVIALGYLEMMVGSGILDNVASKRQLLSEDWLPDVSDPSIAWRLSMEA
jgi:hypothetical protein